MFTADDVCSSSMTCSTSSVGDGAIELLKGGNLINLDRLSAASGDADASTDDWQLIEARYPPSLSTDICGEKKNSKEG